MSNRYLSRLSCSISTIYTIRKTKIKEIKMAKSRKQPKQTSAYKGVTRTPAAIHAMGSLRSWPLSGRGMSEAAQDAEADRRMNPNNWSARKNPVCPVCHVQKSVRGECYC
jgi:hypothetical protein